MEERREIIKLCEEYNDIFFKEGTKLTFTNQIKHKIRTTGKDPIFVKPYRVPYAQQKEVKRQGQKNNPALNFSMELSSSSSAKGN